MQRREFFKVSAALFTIPTAWAEQAAKPDWRPSILDEHQNETVIVLTDLIIPATDTPGAKAARVNRYIDLLLRDGDREPREKFLAGLNWLDGLAISKHGHPFVHCTGDRQVAMLKTLNDGGGPDQEFFEQIKGLTTRIYYNTEIGYRELNKGGRVPASFGCQHEHA